MKLDVDIEKLLDDIEYLYNTGFLGERSDSKKINAIAARLEKYRELQGKGS